MINIRAMRYEDTPVLLELHEKYYKEFNPPNFLRPSIGGFIIEDNKELIMGGTVRLVAECLLITDLSKNRIKIGRSLIEALKFSKYACRENNIDQLHAFVKNEQYAKHLIQHGFSERCKALSIEV